MASYQVQFIGYIIVKGELTEEQRKEINTKIETDHEGADVTFEYFPALEHTVLTIDDDWRSMEPDYELWWAWLQDKYEIIDLDVKAKGYDWDSDTRHYTLEIDGDDPVYQCITGRDVWQNDDPWVVCKKEITNEEEEIPAVPAT